MKKLTLTLFICLASWGAVSAQCADFNISADPVCVGSPVTFTDISSGGAAPFTWNWNFGTGASPATFVGQTPPAVTYSSAGTKNITLTYTSSAPGACNDFRIYSLVVENPPVASFTSTAPDCINSNIDFFNTGSSGGGVTYSWNFGAGATPATSTNQNPSGIDYVSSGSKVVTFTITSPICGAVSTFDTIKIYDPADASFTTSAPGCVGQAANFYHAGSSVALIHSWNFGSGAIPATSTLSNPTGIAYSASGAKFITHDVNNGPVGCAQDSRTEIITINPAPTASFSSNAPQCTGSLVNFTNTGTTGAGVMYAWDFGVGATPAVSTAQNPVGIVFSTGGSKTVTLTVTNQFGCVTLGTQAITINQTPVSSFSSNAPRCTGSNVDFSNTGSTTGVSWAWSFGAGASPATSNLENPTGVVYSTSGTKIVSLMITDTISACMVTATQTININQTPAPAFTSTAPQCQGSLVTFSYTGTTGLGWNYNWDFGTGSTPGLSSAQNPGTVVYSNSGIKNISITVTNNGLCSQTITGNITINPTPVASFTSTTPSCTADSVNFLNTGTAGATSYSWNFGDGATPASSITMSQNNVVYSSAGIKTVLLIITLGTCADTTSQTIDIKQTPAPAFISNSPQCEGAAINLSYTGTSGLGWTYNWDFGTGASPATSSAAMPGSIVYTGAGTKIITLTVSNDICSKTFTGNVTINPTPVASFTSTTPSCTADSVNFLNTGTAGATYSWNFGAGSTPATSITMSQNNVVYSSAGIKTVQLITTLGTCVDTISQTIDIKQTPAPAFASNSPQCEGAAINLSYTGTSGLGWTYNWDFGTGASPAASSAAMPGSVLYTGAGTKTITLTVSNDICSKTITGNVTINPTPVASFTSTTPSCTADSVNFLNTGTTGALYSWSFGTGATPATSATMSQNNVVYSSAGIKTVLLITTLGTCADTTSQTIDIKQTPAPAFTSTSPQCEEAPVAFNYTGTTGLGWTYNWDFGTSASVALSSAQTPGNVLYSTPGTKIITLTVTNDICSKTITGAVVINPLPLANAGKDTVICNNTSIQIGSTSTAGYTYSWFPSSTLNNATISNPVASPIAPVTVYIVTVTNTATGCETTDSIAVTMLAPLVALAGADGEICRFDSIQIGTGLITGQNYVWSPVAGLSSTTLANPVASPAVTTTYTISVTGPGCGPITDEVTIIVHPLPTVNAGQDDSITVGQSTQLIATGGVQYTWAPSYGLSNIGIFDPVANPDTTTQYIVTATDIYGCVNSDTMNVIVIAPSFWIATAFTPDNNGHNDVLFVRGDGINDFEFAVFNRWGEQIFLTKNLQIGWDGTKQGTGQLMPGGAYVYSVKGQLSNGDPVSAKGLVNLIR